MSTLESPSPPGPSPAEIGTDPDALEAFYRHHLPMVRVYVARRVDDPHSAADLTADIFLRAIDSSRRYREDLGSPAAWLIGIARRVLADRGRRRARESAALQRIDARRLLDDASTDRIVERIDSETAARDLVLAAHRLPSGQRDVLELVAVDGLSLVDAARLLGISAGTARTRYHRARTALRTAFPHIPTRTEVIA